MSSSGSITTTDSGRATPPPETSTVSDTEYAVRRRKHLDLIKQLRAIGAQADLDLPRIVVIGNQSAGKSSLVEAISGITVPRDAGTCTRCPMECRLASSTSGTWSCQVYIRWEFDAHGQRLPEVAEQPFGVLITKKADVELALRRAQCAVLNPKSKPESFVRMSAEKVRSHNNELKFSANAVCLDLEGPGLTDLAFVDLPGIIQNAAPETVKMIEDMVVTHIQGNCLILLTIPMSDDIDNQKAARLAKQVDPTGQRTIGVLTKPDTLTVGAVKSKENWLAVLEGRHLKTAHGYFCTRQPDDAERARGITPAEAREAEKTFFSTTNPWSTSKHRQRFGTENLVDSLALLLSKVIDETLPKLQMEVAEQFAACSSELAALPPPITSDPSSYVLNLVLGLCNEVKQHVEGDVTAASLVQQNRRTYALFKRDIRDSALLFLPYGKAAEEPKESDVHQFFRFDEDVETNIDEYADDSVSGVHGKHLYLSDIQQHIRNALTRELPDNVPYAVKVMLIRQSQESWGALSAECCTAVTTAFQKTLKELVNVKFSRYDHLHSRVTKILTDLVRKQTELAQERVRGALELERVPYTQNDHYLQQTKAKYLSLYKDARSGKLQLPAQQPKKRRRDRGENGTVQTSAPTPAVFSFANVPTLAPTSSSPAGLGPPPADNPHRKLASNARVFGLTGRKEADATPIAKAPSGGGSVAPVSAFTLGFGPSGRSTAIPQSTTSSEQSSPEPVYKTPNRLRNKGAEASDSSTPLSEPPTPAVVEQRKTNTGKKGKKRGLSDEEREERENQALSALAALGYHVTAADLGKLNPPDVYESELELMAEVRAYFQIAYKRIIDYVPMTIDHSFLFGFVSAVQESLIEHLGLGTSNAGPRCAAYLAEDHRILSLREELLGKKKRLESVQSELDNFGL
ncbi:P-loop containing nucleoside triphosphate hydrolase protein [Cytidiella melzeri]|nr:P-loop containing nucleoside triphosphate hydrolase protein [Cytidiella melzeri]